MSAWLGGGLMLLGALSMAIAALGLVRLPDLFTRMQAAAKAGTSGAGLLLLGTAVYFGDMQVATRALAVVVFLFLTAPVAAHLLARTGYSLGVPLFRTETDELRERFGQGKAVPGGTPSFDAPARRQEPERVEPSPPGTTEGSAGGSRREGE